MEIGAFFILLILLGAGAILGGGLLALTMWLRHKQLHPEGDKVEHPDDGADSRETRPQHVRADSEQRARFVGSR